jgi:hypothetical protein
VLEISHQDPVMPAGARIAAIGGRGKRFDGFAEC